MVMLGEGSGGLDVKKRRSRGQTLHDEGVEQVAKRLKRQGWDVEAKINGFWNLAISNGNKVSTK